MKDRSFLRLRDILSRYGVSKPTIYRWMREGNFPKPKRIGPRTVRWKAEDLLAYEESKA